MGRLLQTRQFLGGDEGDILRPTPGDDDDLLILGHFIKELRKIARAFE